MRADYPGSRSGPHALQPWIGSLVSQSQKVDQNHLVYPQLSVMAAASAGESSISIWDVSQRPSSDEHLEVTIVSHFLRLVSGFERRGPL